MEVFNNRYLVQIVLQELYKKMTFFHFSNSTCNFIEKKFTENKLVNSQLS